MMRCLLLFTLIIGLGGAFGCDGDSGDDDEFFGLCDETADCDTGRYCELADCGGIGQCETRPTNCSAVPDPVCGCDGNTYLNNCTAKSQGVDVEHNGAC